MAIFSTRAMCPRLCVLGEAAATALLGRNLSVSCPTSTFGKRASISAVQRVAFTGGGPSKHYLLTSSRSRSQDLDRVSAAASSLFRGPFIRRWFATLSTRLLKKGSMKSGSTRTAKSKALGAGHTSNRSMTVRASSRQAQLKVSASARKSGVISEVRTDAKGNIHSKDLQNKTKAKRPAGVGISKQSPVAIKRVSRNQENREGAIDSTKRPSKKGKRVMRLDPEDNTSKRFFEGYPLPGEDMQQDAPVNTVGRAQFRAIVPPPKLMQHIERYMLGRRRPAELQRAGYDMKITPAPLDNIPFSKKGERQPIQEEAFRHKLRFAAAAKAESSLPPVDLPEVAFAGRSNVGKSSLINALTRQWGVARTSDKPGLTQSINFFRLGGRLCLVDLPGYGFAYAAEEKKEAWEEFVKVFVTSRVGLKRVYMLVDAKWGLKLKDEELIQQMEKAGTKYQIVLTKSDLVTPTDLGRRATQIQEVFKANKSLMLPLIMVSSKTGEGLEYFRANIARLAKASLI